MIQDQPRMIQRLTRTAIKPIFKKSKICTQKNRQITARIQAALLNSIQTKIRASYPGYNQNWRLQLLRTYSDKKGNIPNKREVYRVLGLENRINDLTKDELSKRFRELSLKYHPDLNKSHEAARKYIKIKDAYDYIKEDIEERLRRERMGRATQEAKDWAADKTKESMKSGTDFTTFSQKHFKERPAGVDDWDYKTQEAYIFKLIFGFDYEGNEMKFMLVEYKEKRKAFRQQVMEMRGLEDDPKVSDEDFMNGAFQTKFSGVGTELTEEMKFEQYQAKYWKIGSILAILGSIAASFYYAFQERLSYVSI